MSENNRNQSGEEEALSDLISSAIEKKKTVSAQPKPQPKLPSDDEMSLSDSIAQAKYNKEHGIKPKPHVQQPAADDDDRSIEDMVANAMSMKAKGKPAVTQEHFVSKDDIENNAPEDMDDEEETGFFQKIKGFFIRHKLELMIAGLVLVVIAIIVIIAVVMLFNHYYNRIGEGDNSIILESINEIDESDTVSDVVDYEDFLKDQIKPYTDIMGSETVYNILLIGEDLRDTAGQSRGNTDVMLLVSINRETKTITLTSFMRDIYLYIPGYYSTRLNAAYATGGAELLKDTIEQNFGVKIDNYVIVNFYTFIDIIDTIGGIDVELTDNMVYAMKAPMYEQNKYLGNPKNQDIPTSAGSYHLNGNQALGYVRIRKGVGDDYGRTARQREVIGKMITKARELSLAEMFDLLDKVTEGDNIRWDLDKDKVIQLITSAFDYYKNYDIQELQIPANGTFSDQTIRGMAVLCPDFAANTEILQLAIYGKTFINPAQTVTYYLPPSTSVTTREPYVATTTTTTPPQTTPDNTETFTTTEDEPQVPDVTTTPEPDVPTVTTTPPPQDVTTPSQTTLTEAPPNEVTTPAPDAGAA